MGHPPFFFLWLVPVLIVFFEFFFVPGLIAEAGFRHSLRIDHHLRRLRLEAGGAQIGRCGLQCVEEQGGGFVFDLLGEKQTHDLHEGDLNGVGVFEQREIEREAGAARLVGIDLDATLLPALVEETKSAILERRGAALDSVDFDVLTTSDVLRIKKFRNAHERLLPPPSLILWNQEVRRGL